jgi:hypothetical protein
MIPNNSSPKKLSRRRLLALPAAGMAAALPATAIGATEPSPLAGLIDRHRTAAAALDEVCSRINRIEGSIAEKYAPDVCRAWLCGSERGKWLKVRKAHGVEALEEERHRLDKAEKAVAFELLACPCAMIDDIRAKAGYIRQTEIIRESLLRDEAFVDALLASLSA